MAIAVGQRLDAPATIARLAAAIDPDSPRAAEHVEFVAVTVLRAREAARRQARRRRALWLEPEGGDQ